MKLNCKPGDMAVIIGGSVFAGKIVTVLITAPQKEFKLPDGYPHVAANPRSWVIEFHGDTPAFCDGLASPRITRYAVGLDSKLRPLRPRTGDDETLTWAGKPEKVSA